MLEEEHEVYMYLGFLMATDCICRGSSWPQFPSVQIVLPASGVQTTDPSCHSKHLCFVSDTCQALHGESSGSTGSYPKVLCAGDPDKHSFLLTIPKRWSPPNKSSAQMGGRKGSLHLKVHEERRRVPGSSGRITVALDSLLCVHGYK